MAEPPLDDPAGLVESTSRSARLARKSQVEGEPRLARQLATIGVLGWIIVLPTLGGLAIGRFADRRAGTGIVFTAASMLVGLAIGAWSAWRWMQGEKPR